MIAGGGFSLMAWREAKSRANPDALVISTREAVMRHGPDCNRASREFYRICDNAVRGFSAFQTARRLNMFSDNPVVYL